MPPGEDADAAERLIPEVIPVGIGRLRPRVAVGCRFVMGHRSHGNLRFWSPEIVVAKPAVRRVEHHVAAKWSRELHLMPVGILVVERARVAVGEGPGDGTMSHSSVLQVVEVAQLGALGHLPRHLL